jgi:hypothetical protein
MSDCQRCCAKCQLYLCTRCSADLRAMLLGLATGWEVQSDHKTYQTAGYIEWLQDKKLGRTRLGESARRSSERSRPLPVHTGPRGDWVGSPSEMLDNVHNVLMRWVEVVNVRFETLSIQEVSG